MISDNSRISLDNGQFAPAIAVFPGREVLSFNHKRMTIAHVLDRQVENRSDAVCLLLSNGQKLTGSRDQKVAVFRAKSVQFRALAEIEIGDHLRGERAGMPTVVSVIGLAFDSRPVRLVGFDLRGKNFVAEGVLCR